MLNVPTRHVLVQGGVVVGRSDLGVKAVHALLGVGSVLTVALVDRVGHGRHRLWLGVEGRVGVLTVVLP